MDPIEQNIMLDEVVDRLFYGPDNFSELPPMRDTIVGPKKAILGIVLQHGFIGSNIEMMYLANKLASYGYRVLVPLLPGHGINYNALHLVTYDDWVTKIQEAIDYIQSEKPDRKIIMAGHSLGGTLGIQIAAKSQTIRALITMAAPIAYPTPIHQFVRIVNRFNPNLLIKYKKFIFHDRRLYDHPYINFLNTHYSHITIKSLYQAIQVMDKSRKLIKSFNKPLLVFHANLDKTVWKDNGWKIYSRSASKRKWFVRLDKSYHIVPVDADKDKVLERILKFLEYMKHR